MQKLPSVVFYNASLLLAIAAAVLINNHDLSETRPLECLIANLFLTCEVLKFHILFGQSFFFGHIFIGIMDKFECINKLMSGSQISHLNYVRFQKKFAKKVISVLVFYLFNIAIFTIENYPLKRNSVYMAIFKIWHFTTTLSLIHIVFYVDLLGHHLQQLILIFQHNDQTTMLKSNKDMQRTTLLKKAKNYKITYYHLWAISQEINKIFGWSMAAILLQAFVHSTYASYSIALTILEHRPFSTILCK